MGHLRDKYDDLKAEWLTLHQTNAEYKRTLQQKIKDALKLTKESELSNQRADLVMKEL
jgi:hypothetical protein